jgi:hypothetical protein
MTEVAARVDPFEIELYGADVFPRWSKPRLVRRISVILTGLGLRFDLTSRSSRLRSCGSE